MSENLATTSWRERLAKFMKPNERHLLGGCGISTLLHLGMITILGAFALPLLEENSPDTIKTAWAVAEPPELEFEDLTPQITLEQESGGADAQADMRETIQFTNATEVTLPQTVANVNGMSFSPDWWTPTKAEAAGTQKGGGNGMGEGTGDGAGNGNGTGEGEGFFGTKLMGKRFVFVVDCSGSMSARHYGPMKTRFNRLKQELAFALNLMTPEQQFYIIFFNHTAIPMPSRGLQAATPIVKGQVLNWIGSSRPSGGTDPRAALTMALRMQPDAIYFLTDGDFSLQIRKELGRLRQQISAVHTFTFGDKSSEQAMKNLALNNKGRYRFISDIAEPQK